MINKKNIRIYEGVTGTTYGVVKKINGEQISKTFKTLEEAEEYLKNLDKNSKRANFDYPLDIIDFLFKDYENVDIAYIENNFDTNLQIVLETIPEREARIFLKSCKDGYTLEAIGLQEGITRERVRQIVAKAERRLKHPSRLAILKRGKEVKELQEDVAKLTFDLYKRKLELIEQINNPNTIILSKEEKLQSIKIEDLDFSVRTYSCLKRANINKLTDLLSKREEDLMKIRNFGRKSLREVNNKLDDMKLSLKSYGITKISLENFEEGDEK